MNCTLSNEMTASNTGENTRLSESTNCTHENTKKARKFGDKCALCHTRVWKFWKTRKCLDCKCIVHRSCLVARENENARNPTVGPTTATEATARTVTSDRATAVGFSAERLAAGNRDAPMYVTPTPWSLANITAVTVDCRRRPAPVVVVVSHGRELSVAMFAGLFDSLPVGRRRATARPSTPVSVWEADLMETVGKTQPPRHRRRPVDWYTGAREAGGWRLETGDGDDAAVGARLARDAFVTIVDGHEFSDAPPSA